MVQIVFLDVDNTLLDFDRCSESVIVDCFEKTGLIYHASVFRTFYRVNCGLWRQVEQGTLTRKALYAVRWQKIFSELGITYDASSFEKMFFEGLQESHIPVPGAEELVRYLAGKYTLCVASNAMEKQQKRRLSLSGMLPYIKYFFFSHEIGYPKPSKEFFTFCQSSFPDVPPSDMILIGDSLTADIRGGIDCGMQTCWFNPQKAAAPPETQPTYTVSALCDIKIIL